MARAWLITQWTASSIRRLLRGCHIKAGKTSATADGSCIRQLCTAVGCTCLVDFRRVEEVPDSVDLTLPSAATVHLVVWVLDDVSGVTLPESDKLVAALLRLAGVCCNAEVCQRALVCALPRVFAEDTRLRRMSRRQLRVRAALRSGQTRAPRWESAALSRMDVLQAVRDVAELGALDIDAADSALAQVTPLNYCDVHSVADAVAEGRETHGPIHTLLRNGLLAQLQCLGIAAAGEVVVVIGAHTGKMDVVVDTQRTLFFVDVSLTEDPAGTAAAKRRKYRGASLGARRGTFFPITGQATAQRQTVLGVLDFVRELARALVPKHQHSDVMDLLQRHILRLFVDCTTLRDRHRYLAELFSAPPETGSAEPSVSISLVADASSSPPDEPQPRRRS